MSQVHLIAVSLADSWPYCQACGEPLALGDPAHVEHTYDDSLYYCAPTCQEQRIRNALREAEFCAWLDSQDGAPDAAGEAPTDPRLSEQYRRDALRALGLTSWTEPVL